MLYILIFTCVHMKLCVMCELSAKAQVHIRKPVGPSDKAQTKQHSTFYRRSKFAGHSQRSCYVMTAISIIALYLHEWIEAIGMCETGNGLRNASRAKYKQLMAAHWLEALESFVDLRSDAFIIGGQGYKLGHQSRRLWARERREAKANGSGALCYNIYLQ